MDIYVLYLVSSIPEIKNMDGFKADIRNAVAKNMRISEPLNVIPLKCSKLTGNSDIHIIIAGKCDLGRSNPLRAVETAVTDAIQMDQGLPRPYKTTVRIDSNYQPDIPTPKQLTTDDKSSDDELDYEKRAENYHAVDPEYSFDRVILPNKVLEKIDEALNILKYEDKVFKEWGLRAIEPHPSSSLSFFGPSGTGKTMAAEAIAHRLGKKILRVSYADIESKFHGEGPKMVKAIFYAAQRDNAVLFIDEADSLLSKRLTNVSSGSEQAINSMRSQLLISLERFEGIVIFATNLVVNYDQAFLTRLISVEFVLPDAEARKKIWYVHTKESGGNQLNIPLAADVNFDALAEKYEFCGREIKKAVISACIRAATAESPQVSQDDFISACDRILEEEKSLLAAKDHTVAGNKNLSQEQENALKVAIKAKIAEQNTSNLTEANVSDERRS